ncbi:MAG: Endopolyphosphatase [Pleopsidium flavum]|nr:MAG: Endopolyphosphatase [Pleopsidium flavum]
MQQYRDVVVGSMYGHMNIDHFLLQDSKDIDMKVVGGLVDDAGLSVTSDDELTVQSSADYLTELRAQWSELPDPPSSESIWTARENIFDVDKESAYNNRKGRTNKEDREKKKYLRKIGGRWGERYCAALVSPSVIPKYLPTLRVIYYNITGLEHDSALHPSLPAARDAPVAELEGLVQHEKLDNIVTSHTEAAGSTKKKHRRKPKNKKKHKKAKKPRSVIPAPPSKSSPPGPAYSPQTFTWLGYTQYYANLTQINHDYNTDVSTYTKDEACLEEKFSHGGKNYGKDPHDKQERMRLNPFQFEVEYDTRNDSIYKLKDLTMRSWLDVARRIADYKPEKEDQMEVEQEDVDDDEEKNDGELEEESNIDEILDVGQKKHKGRRKKHRKHRKRKAINKVWFTFVKRAFVGTLDDADLHDEFGQEEDLSNETRG